MFKKTQILNIYPSVPYIQREKNWDERESDNWLGRPHHINTSISFDVLELEIPRVCFLMVEFNFCNILFKDFSESLYIEDNEHKPDVSFDTVAGYDNARMDQCEYTFRRNLMFDSYWIYRWTLYHLMLCVVPLYNLCAPLIIDFINSDHFY